MCRKKQVQNKFRLNDLRDETELRFLTSCEILLDTADYLPEKYANKLLAMKFKLFKRQNKACRKEARKS